MAKKTLPIGAPQDPPGKRTRTKKTLPTTGLAVIQPTVIEPERQTIIYNGDNGPKDYRNDPVAYAREILAHNPTPVQEKVSRLLLTPPYRVLVGCGHTVGKTHEAATLTSWMFDTHGEEENITITTAPTHRDVTDVLWREVRVQRTRAGLGGFVGNTTPELRGATDKHYAKGFTAEKGESFSGRHAQNMLFIFDEATGISPMHWETAQSMWQARPGHYWVCFFNPLNVSCQAFKEWQRDDWHHVQMSSLDHPNVIAGLRGEPDPVPGAVSLRMVNGWVKQWCDPIDVAAERELTDLQWPPGSGIFYRPSPVMEARALGIWPTSGVFGIWSLKGWENCKRPITWIKRRTILPEGGCDVAFHGCFDDQTEILTDQGFKFFDELLGDEKVLTLRGDMAEWGEITQIHKYPFDGLMNLHDNEQCNFCITDNHRLLAKSPHKNAPPWSLKELHELPGEFIMKKISSWQGADIGKFHFLSERATPHGGLWQREWSFSALDWAEFLGWFVSEGSVFIDKKNRCVVQIAQIKSEEKKKQIADLLARMGLINSYTGRSFMFSNNAIGHHLLEHCGKYARNKRVPKYMKDATTEQIVAFLESFCSGDGSRRKGRRLFYHTSSPILADDIQEMLVKIGTCGKMTKNCQAGTSFVIEGRTVTRRNDTYTIGERTAKKDLWVVKRNIQKIPYKGFVHCVSTPLQTILVRRKGCMMWSGNSNYTTMHFRWGPESIHHERHNGWSPRQTAARLKMLCQEMSVKANAIRPPDTQQVRPEDILVKIDADGIGYEVVNLRDGFNFQGMSGGGNAIFPDRYYNRRAECWYYVAQLAKDGLLSVAKLPKDVQSRLQDQLLAPTSSVADNGTILMEKKDAIAKRLPDGSPDDADALILAYASNGTAATMAWESAALAETQYQPEAKEPWRPPSTTDHLPQRLSDYDEDDGPSRKLWRFGC